MEENHFLQGPPYDLREIYEEGILIKLANNFPADIYFFIWRCCEEDDKLSFKFTLPVYFDSRFQMRAVKYLSRLKLVDPITWKGPHVGTERLKPSDIKLTKDGRNIFKEWLDFGFIDAIVNLPHDIRRDVRVFNNYFYENFKCSMEYEQRKNKLPKIEIIDYVNSFFLEGPDIHKIQVCVEYRQKVSIDRLSEEMRLVVVQISCGFCNEKFEFTIMPKTYNKYIKSKKAIRRGCPNCKFPNYGTRYLLFFYRNEFNFERFLTRRSRVLLYNQKYELKNQILLKFKIFISNNVYGSSEKRLIINIFENELDMKWNELKDDNILFDEFEVSVNNFYDKKKKEIRDSLNNCL